MSKKAHPYILLALGLVASLAFFSATQMTATAQSQNLPSIKPVVTPDTVVAQYTAVEGVLIIISPALTHEREENTDIVVVFNDGSIGIQAAYLYDVAGYKYRNPNLDASATDWFLRFCD